jgi:hypothetical protein
MKRLLVLWLFLNASICGCAQHAKSPASSANDSPHVLRMNDSIDLAKLLRADEQVNLTHKLNMQHDGGTIYFGELDTYDDEDQLASSAPIIVRKSGTRWRGIRVSDPRLKDANWAYVGAGPKPGEIWGILDQSSDIADEVQAELIIAHSTDGGQTFSLMPLPKPNDAASFDSICIGPNGRGRLTMYLSSEDESTERPGFYHFQTSDSGRTWARAARYEADALSAAQSVSDDEQPDLQNPVQTASFNRRHR